MRRMVKTPSRMIPRKKPRKVGMTTPQLESQSPPGLPAATWALRSTPSFPSSVKLGLYLLLKKLIVRELSEFLNLKMEIL